MLDTYRVTTTKIHGLKQLLLEPHFLSLHGTVMLSKLEFPLILGLCAQTFRHSPAHQNSTLIYIIPYLCTTYFPLSHTLPIFQLTPVTFLTHNIIPKLLLLCESWHARGILQQNLREVPEGHPTLLSALYHTQAKVCCKSEDMEQK